jgi:hypothetical protein
MAKTGARPRRNATGHDGHYGSNRRNEALAEAAAIVRGLRILSSLAIQELIRGKLNAFIDLPSVSAAPLRNSMH